MIYNQNMLSHHGPAFQLLPVRALWWHRYELCFLPGMPMPVQVDGSRDGFWVVFWLNDMNSRNPIVSTCIHTWCHSLAVWLFKSRHQMPGQLEPSHLGYWPTDARPSEQKNALARESFTNKSAKQWKWCDMRHGKGGGTLSSSCMA